MSRNGSGVFTLPAGNPVVTGTSIESTWANDTMSDVADELTSSLDRSGRGGMLAAFKAYDGLVGTPGIAWATEPTSGWYRIGAGSFGLAVLGSNIMTVSASGVVATRLTINDNAAANSLLTLKTAGVTYSWFGSSEGTSGNASGAGWRSETYAQITTGGGTQRLRVLATGPVVLGTGTTNVGIGSGADLLAVPGTIGFSTQLNGLPGAATPVQIINRSTGGMQLFVDEANTLAADWDVDGNLSMSGDVEIDGAVTARGVGLTAVKTVITTRNNTASLAADPDLVVALPTGWFDIELFLPISIGVSGGGDGFKYNFTTTGTIANDTQASYGLNKALASQGGQDFASGGSCAAMSSGSTEWITIKGVCQVTVAGNLTFQWAQNSAGAHNTSIRAGGFMKCTKLA